jgi:hypothetical protein
MCGLATMESDNGILCRTGRIVEPDINLPVSAANDGEANARTANVAKRILFIVTANSYASGIGQGMNRARRRWFRAIPICFCVRIDVAQ